jgi:hypothetical protein
MNSEALEWCRRVGPDATIPFGRAYTATRRLLKPFNLSIAERARWMLSVLRGRACDASAWGTVQRWAERYVRQQHPDVYGAQLRAREAGGLAGAYQFVRLWEISALLQYFQPSTCLELGSGTSSILFAKHFQSAERFVTVEESPQWHARLMEIL